MKSNSKSIVELHKMLVNGEISSKDLCEESLNLCKLLNKETNSFITILDDYKVKDVNDNFLSGIPFGAKDNYSTKGILTTGSSKTLINYVPIFNATALENLYKNNAVLIAKTNLDEMCMGGDGTTGLNGNILNPWDHTRSCAGSSSGSAASVAYGAYPYALGSDTGDSIRKPAAYCGVVGYKPTYGLVSRFGVFAFASSLDHCGVLTRSVKDAAIVIDGMKGIDNLDMTSYDSKEIKLYDSIDGKINNKKLFYIKELTDISLFPNANRQLKEHLNNFKEKIELLKNMGYMVEEVSFDIKLLRAISSTYRVISCAEAVSNMASLTGMVFGPRFDGETYEECMIKYRTEGFTPLIKRRFVIGSYVLQESNKDRYFYNAQRVRRLIVDKFKELFAKYDALVLPVGRGPALHFDKSLDDYDKESEYLEDHLQIGNFGGFPSITIPSGFIDGMPVGINFTGNCYDDINVLNIAYSLEQKLPYENQTVGGKNE